MNCLPKVGLLCSVILPVLFGCMELPDRPDRGALDSCQIVSAKGIFYVRCDSVRKITSPEFSQLPGALSYGTKVILTADSIPAESVFEISLDSGKVWKAANQLSVVNSVQLWARIRFNQLLSPVSKVAYSVYYSRVLIVGNSITGHGPAPEIGWLGDWGMAASSADKDYLHIITSRLQKANPKVEVKKMYGVNFEKGYWKYDYKEVTPYVDFQPDLIIMRIAENVDLNYLYDFEGKYENLLNMLKGTASPKVICTTSIFANQEEASKLIRNVAKRRGYVLADLAPFSRDKSYTAFGLFQDAGVALHPSDKGMQAIADCISAYF